MTDAADQTPRDDSRPSSQFPLFFAGVAVGGLIIYGGAAISAVIDRERTINDFIVLGLGVCLFGSIAALRKGQQPFAIGLAAALPLCGLIGCGICGTLSWLQDK